jgi:hypothetical protein
MNTNIVSTYSIAPVERASSYDWTVPMGATIVDGQGTTTIHVLFDNTYQGGNFLVSATSHCGSSYPSILRVGRYIPAIPTVIYGPTNACALISTTPITVTYSIDSVPLATSYTWYVPNGAQLLSGQGTTSITVTYTAAFVSGSIAVKSNANCGSSRTRTLVIYKYIPAIPVAINGPANACAYVGTNTQVTYSIDSVPNALSYQWTLPANVTLVSGQGTNSINVIFNKGF